MEVDEDKVHFEWLMRFVLVTVTVHHIKRFDYWETFASWMTNIKYENSKHQSELIAQEGVVIVMSVGYDYINKDLGIHCAAFFMS
jgi:hypothetical protein